MQITKSNKFMITFALDSEKVKRGDWHSGRQWLEGVRDRQFFLRMIIVTKESQIYSYPLPYMVIIGGKEEVHPS